MFDNIPFFSEILATILATIYYKKYNNTPLKYLLIILWSVVLTESLGHIMAQAKILLYEGTYSYWLYNIMGPIWILIYLYIYHETLENIKNKKWIKLFIIIYPVLVFINFVFFENFLTDLEGNSKIAGSLFIVIAAILYLLELLQSDKIIQFHRKLLFWVSVGLLIFYGGTIPFTVVRDYYANINPEAIPNIFLIIYILGTLMYLLFSFGFIWSKKE